MKEKKARFVKNHFRRYLGREGKGEEGRGKGGGGISCKRGRGGEGVLRTMAAGPLQICRGTGFISWKYFHTCRVVVDSGKYGRIPF